MSRRSIAFGKKKPEDGTLQTMSPMEEKISEIKNDVFMERSSINVDIKRNPPKRKVGALWNLEEAMAFYDALKENGKNFDAILSYLEKKKFRKDKDQVRNFYYNTFKMYKDKANIAESEWSSVSHSIREMLVVICALEWRKRTNSSNIQPSRYKALVMMGSTTVKVAGKRTAVTIRTPNCRAIRRFFPMLKEPVKVPSSIKLLLAPYSESARNYVMSCGQNPQLSLTLNIQSSLSGLFQFLEQKWSRRSVNNDKENEFPTISFYPPKGFKIPQVAVQTADGQNPCINSLLLNTALRPQTSQGSVLKIPQSIVRGFDELCGSLTVGLTADYAHNISFLHLFYLFHQQVTIELRYDVNGNERTPNTFLKLCDVINSCESLLNSPKLQKYKPELKRSSTEINVSSKRQPNFRLAQSEESGTVVVDTERARFKDQLASLRNRPVNNGKKPTVAKKPIPQQNKVPYEIPSSSTTKDTVFFGDDAVDSFGFPTYRRSVQNGRTYTTLRTHASELQISPDKNTSNSVHYLFNDGELSQQTLTSPSNSLQDYAFQYYQSADSNDIANDLFNAAESSLFDIESLKRK